jgi:hypothetical protein
MAETAQDKKLSEVSDKLSKLNGTTEVGLGNVQNLTETLVAQSKASLEATDAAAAAETESRKEAARARKDKLGATDVNVLNWQKQDGGMFDTLADMLAMKFAWGGLGLVGLGAAVVAAISGALIGASAGLVTGFLSMWGKIFKFFGNILGGKLASMFPNVTATLKGIFGKGGKISQFITAIKAFFTESKVFKSISNAFLKFKTMLTTFGTKISKFFSPITKLFGGGGGPISKFFSTFGKFFKIFRTFFAKLFYPIQVIISLVEGFFEAKDAVSKSKGIMATFFNAIIGFFGGILDGLIFGMLDLIKDGVSWIAGFLGFEDVEKLLDSFSFSDMFNEFLDDIYEWFNLLFSDPVAALTNLFAGYFGGMLSVGDFILDMLKKPLVWIMKLFGWDDAAESTEKFSLKEWVMGKWKAVKDWFTGLLSWGKDAGATEEGGWSFTKFIGEAWQKIKDYFTNLLTFEGAGGEKIGLGDKIMELFKSIPDKIVQLFKDMIAKVQQIFSSISMPWEDTPEEKQQKGREIQAKIKEHQVQLAAGDTKDNLFRDRKNQIKLLQEELSSIPGFAEGGLVKGTGIAKLHGSPTSPELVLDNQAASLFMQAAQMLSSLHLEGILVRAEASSGGNVSVVNAPATTINKSDTGFVFPTQSIRPNPPNILPA